MFAVVKYVGGWTVVAMLTERYLTTRKPQLARDYCSACFAKVGLTEISVVETDILLLPRPRGILE